MSLKAVTRSLAFCFLLAVTLFSGAREGRAETAALVVSAAEVDYPPFSLVNKDGQADGFAVELLRAALGAMGREVTFRTGTWAEVRGWLEHGEVQALPLVGRTPERESLFDFTVPYMTLHGAIVVRGEERDIRDLRDLRGRPVAVMKGDNAEEFLLRGDSGVLLRTTPTFEIALRELAAGRVDGVVMQRLVALRLVQQTGLTNLRVIERPIEGFEQDFSFAVREQDRETLALLNEGLAVVMADGTYRRLHAKWFASMQLPAARPLVIGGDRNFPPYEFLDEHGEPTGYNVEMTRALAREMGLNVEIRLGHWPERLKALDEGRIDAIQGMFYSTARDLRFDFAPAHVVVHYVAVVRAGEGPAPETAEDLAGKRVVVQRDDILHDFLVESGLAEHLSLADDQEEALRQLVGGRHDCAVVARATALFLKEKHGWTELELARQPLLVPEYSYATGSGQQALLAELGEGLRVLESSGEYRRIHSKWLGVYSEEETTFREAMHFSLRFLVPLLAALLLVLVWSWALRRQVAQKTRELQESVERFRGVFESANVGKTITLPTGEIDANRALADFLGYTPGELRGKRWQDLTPPEDVAGIETLLAPLLAGEREAARFEKRYVHRSGDYLWADVSTAVQRDPEGRPLYLVTTIVDITERKKAESERERLHSQLLQAQKMESVGRLAGGVAHDFNNMLSVIIAVADIALEDCAPDEQLRHDLEEILGAARRAADFSRQLLAFARRQTIAPKAIDLNESLEAMLKMLRRLIGEDIDLLWKPGRERLTVYLDPSQLDQILANLCVNARDAIEDVGKLTIETARVTFDEEYCESHAGCFPGDFVLLAVSDDGCGMDADTLAKVFEPFFTTKGVGRGTGLGLSTVFGIVKQNGGFINVYSEPGRGTTFRVYLKLHAGDAGPAEVLELPEDLSGNGETVLIVEDEGAILSAARKILERLGYAVQTASNPREAEALAGASGGTLRLLITDVVMPELNGRELADRLQAGHPELKVLFMSGYTANVIAHQGVLDEGVNFLPKPFSSRDLARAVRAALDRPRSA